MTKFAPADFVGIIIIITVIFVGTVVQMENSRAFRVSIQLASEFASEFIL